MILNNNEYFKIGNSQMVTVSVTFQAQPMADQKTNLLNAAQALKYLADNGEHQSWVKRVEIK